MQENLRAYTRIKILKLRTLFVTLVLALGLVKAEESKNLPQFIPASNRTPDLDFNEEASDLPPLELKPGLVNPEYHLLYWTLGSVVVAGGMFLFFWEKDKPTSIQKSVQEFNDSGN